MEEVLPNQLSKEDEVTLRMLKTPPKPHADMKIGRKRSPGKAKSPAKSKPGDSSARRSKVD
jgi:hypothetical protein